jgi:hypothetical protein
MGPRVDHVSPLDEEGERAGGQESGRERPGSAVGGEEQREEAREQFVPHIIG